MRFQSGILMGLLLAAGCRDATSPGAGLQRNTGEGDRTISGQVITLDMQPDSHYVSVAGVTLTLIKNSSGGGIDTTGVPPDSTVLTVLRPRSGILALDGGADTIPGDSVHLPPIGACGSGADTVGTATTDDQGHFTFSGLAAGSYDLIAEASETHYTNSACGIDLNHHASSELQLFVAAIVAQSASIRPRQ